MRILKLLPPLVLLAATLCAPAALAQDAYDPLLEARVKAAFTYKFASYVDWPASAFADPTAPLVVAVVGADAIAEELAHIAAGRTAHGRPITVRRIAPGQRIPAAHIVFLGDRTAARMPQLVRSLPGSVLVVTESEGWLEGGGVINLQVVDGRMRFEVALDAAERRGLTLSSRLLGVALRVHRTAS